MAGTVIVGSGGGHAAVKFLAENYHTFTTQEQADAVTMLRTLVTDVNTRFDKCFDTERL